MNFDEEHDEWNIKMQQRCAGDTITVVAALHTNNAGEETVLITAWKEDKP